VFFDRDGVLNHAILRDGKPYPPATLDELEIVSDASSALNTLSDAGFLLVGVTNQPDVSRGTQGREVVEAINRILLSRLPLQDIRVCFHDDRDDCACRKPRPGLLIGAAAVFELELSSSFLVGDRWKDVEAGHRAGCTTILIDRGYSEAWLGRPPHHTVNTLAQAANWIIQQVREGGEAI